MHILGYCGEECLKYVINILTTCHWLLINQHDPERKQQNEFIGPDKESYLHKISIIFLPIRLNMCFGCP